MTGPGPKRAAGGTNALALHQRGDMVASLGRCRLTATRSLVLWPAVIVQGCRIACGQPSWSDGVRGSSASKRS
jgi:hypothetical protein